MAIKTVFAFFLVLAGFAVTSFAGTINLSNSKITLTGTGTIKVDPVETFWAGLTKNRRYPTILSGDLFALKLYRSSGTPKWMQCSKSASCTTSTCPRGQVMLNSKFSSCKTVVFRIRTLGKPDGQVVEAGDYVVMSFPFFGEASWGVSTPWPRRYWLNRNQAKFQIFAKNADEGKPIQYGDTVGFKTMNEEMPIYDVLWDLSNVLEATEAAEDTSRFAEIDGDRRQPHIVSKVRILYNFRILLILEKK
ncbi:hypothetical protein AC249_AIPGENE27038 [Exaiptasia diaphana]|nr:hypothetical protein AC249_AIPGENE27038 [Exaiptasia diaphana]